MQGLAKRSVIIGGNGALGRTVVNAFRDTWEVTSVDFKENSKAHCNIVLNRGSTEAQNNQCRDTLKGKYDALICVAGGWVGGSISSDQIFSQTLQMIEII